MDQQFLDVVNKIKTDKSGVVDKSEQELLKVFSDYYSQLSKFDSASFKDKNLAAASSTLLICTKAVVQVKTLILKGNDLGAADLVLVIAFNDALSTPFKKKRSWFRK